VQAQWRGYGKQSTNLLGLVAHTWQGRYCFGFGGKGRHDEWCWRRQWRMVTTAEAVDDNDDVVGGAVDEA